MAPSVSVVIPARNEEDNIGACLGRLVEQTTARDEILVLDNGSTDGTAAVASEFDAVRVFDAPDSRFEGDGHLRGLAQLRQFGAEQASNEIVATTDADTLPPADWLDRIRAHFRDDPDLTVVWGVVTDTNGVPVRNLTGKYLTFLGGVSGSNTAFRREAFEDLSKGYVGWPVFEDVALITRLARTGKAVHDTGMVMQSDLDRQRYQTIPMVASGGAGVVAGALVGGPIGAFAAGSGIGLGGTELVYEEVPTTDAIHHDQVGMGLILGGVLLGGPLGMAAAGSGSGIVAHHLLTEGASALPTGLLDATDQVCQIPEEGSIRDIECRQAADRAGKTTRVLAGMTLGGVAASALSAVRARGR